MSRGSDLGALDVRVKDYLAAIKGPKTQASSWNFLAAAAALGMGIELKSAAGTISGLAWLVSQAEAWVDEANFRKASETMGGPNSKALVDWKIPAGAAIVAVSIWRASKNRSIVGARPWQWV